jgi:hypothetical protein
MAASRGSVGAWVALGASALFLAVAIAYRFRTAAPPPAPAPPSTGTPRPAAPNVPAKAEPKSAEGRAALKIAGILSEARSREMQRRAAGAPATPAEKVEAERREREAQDASALLVESLHKNPASWPEVLDLVSMTEDLKVALQLAARLGEAMDAMAEPLIAARVTRHAVARMRQVAATALAAGKTPDSLTALIDAADRDADGGVRLAAVTSLAQRRLGSSPETQLSIESALRRRAQSDGDDYIRQVSKNLVDPQPPPGASRPDTAKKRLLPPSAPPK